MTEEEYNKTITVIIAEVVNKLDIEEIIRDTMIDHDIHPFSDEVSENQVHIAYNEIYGEVIERFQHDKGLY
jgi:ERCC4-related helicase